MKSDEALPVVRELRRREFLDRRGRRAVRCGAELRAAGGDRGRHFLRRRQRGRHVMEPARSRNENIAMVSDLFAFIASGAPYVASPIWLEAFPKERAESLGAVHWTSGAAW